MFDFSFLDPLRQMAGPGASFPFGAPPMDAPSGPASASWGPPPVPGTPQGAADRSSMMVAGPGAPTAAPPAPPPSPLRAGAPPPGRSDGPPIATPQQAAAARVTPGTPAAVSGPTGAVDASGQPIKPVVASDPALRAPYAQPGSPVPGAPAGSPPATAPATAPAAPAAPGEQSMGDKLKALGQNKDFMGALGKMAGGGGGGGGGSLDLSTGSPGGDPAAASRQGSADLFKSIVEGGRPGGVPPVPEFDPKKFLFAGM